MRPQILDEGVESMERDPQSGLANVYYVLTYNNSATLSDSPRDLRPGLDGWQYPGDAVWTIRVKKWMTGRQRHLSRGTLSVQVTVSRGRRMGRGGGQNE